MGQMAGRNVWPAIAGFLITGVGLPLLGVIALGKQPLQRTDGDEPAYRQAVRCLFTCALYLTIGPFCNSEMRHRSVCRWH